MSGITKNTKISPSIRDVLSKMASGMSGDLVINIVTSNVTPTPQTGPWTYTVTFQLENSTGQLMDWYNGTINAGVADTSVAGTATISSATPTITNGIGTIVIEETGANAWLDTETATLTLNGTIMGYTLADQTFVATFTA